MKNFDDPVSITRRRVRSDIVGSDKVGNNIVSIEVNKYKNYDNEKFVKLHPQAVEIIFSVWGDARSEVLKYILKQLQMRKNTDEIHMTRALAGILCKRTYNRVVRQFVSIGLIRKTSESTYQVNYHFVSNGDRLKITRDE